MKIGVIADTHLSRPTETLRMVSQDVFKDVSLILHAGDLTRIEVLDAFHGKKIVAVCGNMDSREVTRVLPKREIVEVEGMRIGLVHGWGAPFGLETRVAGCFTDVEVIVFGHTHKAANHMRNGILMFNPGAFSGTFFMKRHCSVGLLTLGHGATGRIVPI